MAGDGRHAARWCWRPQTMGPQDTKCGSGSKPLLGPFSGAVPRPGRRRAVCSSLGLGALGHSPTRHQVTERAALTEAGEAPTPTQPLQHRNARGLRMQRNSSEVGLGAPDHGFTRHRVPEGTEAGEAASPSAAAKQFRASSALQRWDRAAAGQHSAKPTTQDTRCPSGHPSLV